MLVAVQGCSHGSLSAIYDSVAQYEQLKGVKVEVLLLCGDFQALRSENDFASLAVPDKFKSLGTFHQYYSGIKKAPVLTIVIGGNHEASNYMWELYHGGWLAPDIYYLGAAGSVIFNGVRISGASGIFKGHDYGKGHFEKMPLNSSTLRSIYHIRQYDVTKLMQLSRREHTIFLSHDWPISIAHHGNTGALLSRKPFFKEEVRTNTLGSPPLLTLLKHLQPEHWFAAHLHVKFAAVFEHSNKSASDSTSSSRSITERLNGTSVPSSREQKGCANPDEIAIEDDFDAPGNPDEIPIEDDEVLDEEPPHSHDTTVSGNPDEIRIEDDDDFDNEAAPNASTADAKNDLSGLPVEEAEEALKIDESVDLVEAVRRGHGDTNTQGFIGTEIPKSRKIIAGPSTSSSRGEKVTKFLALDKCGPGKDFIQFLDIPSPSSETNPPIEHKLCFDPEWLAITRALHPYLTLDTYQRPLPSAEVIQQLVSDERVRLDQEGLLVPALPLQPGPSSPKETTAPTEDAPLGGGPNDPPPLVWEKGMIEITRVQKFWPTAPAHGQPGGSPSAWYTNPQTEAFCGMLGIEMKINPAPGI